MTKKEFDPYHRWLGIPASEQPANHYRLLGIALFEADADVIESAAIRQTTHVRSHALGSHGDTTQTVLNEIAEAKITLLHPEKKKQYDEKLRSTAKVDQDSPLDVFIQTNAVPSSSAKQPSSKTHHWKNAKQRRQAYLAASAGWICFVLALMWLGFGNEPTGNPVARPSVKQASKTSPKKPETTTTRNVKPPPSTAVAPFDAVKAKQHQQAWADHLAVPVVTTNSIGMKLALIPPGEFLMGSDEFEEDAKPTHKVTLTQPFLLGVYEVTQEQYEKVIGGNPSKFKGPQNPAEVSWPDALAFCSLLTDYPEEKLAGRTYRLPTEAEWEYSCRAGTTTAYSFGDDASLLPEFAWVGRNSGGRTHPVGEKKPNAWGLYDMHGNVWERLMDWKGNYPQGSVVNPQGPSEVSSFRVTRGGGFGDGDNRPRSAHRGGSSTSNRSSHNGFRVVCVISDDKQPTTTAITSVESKPVIPEDAVQFGGHHYQIVTDKVTWMHAKRDAENKGGHLLRVNSQPEFDFISTLFISRNLPRCWIDGSRLLLGGNNWLYSNGDRVDLTVFPHKIFENADSDLFLNLARNKANQVCVWDGTLRFKGKTELDIYIIEWDE